MRPDGMGADMHRERQHMAEMRHEDEISEGTHKLRVTRPHPTQDRRVGEIWGHGSKESLELKAAEKRAEYGDEYEFTVVEK